jgi:transcriptional regulator with XRE-family HTH domain
MSYLGPYILSRLREKKWKQRDLAEMAGIKESTLSKYISGDRTPPDQAIREIAHALGTSQEVLSIAQGRIPERLHRLLYDHADATLSLLNRLAAKTSREPDHIEELARSVLFRYLNEIGRGKFTYPVDVRTLLECVYGIEVHEASFNGMDLPKTRGDLCGLLIPGYAQLGSQHYSNAVLLNRDVLGKYGQQRGRAIARFTMAHEAFHKEMWDSREMLSSSRRSVVYCRIRNIPADEDHDFRAERKANQFAGALLMPAKDVRRQLEKYPNPLDLTAHGEELRSRYDVTISALKVRLRELGVSFIGN